MSESELPCELSDDACHWRLNVLMCKMAPHSRGWQREVRVMDNPVWQMRAMGDELQFDKVFLNVASERWRWKLPAETDQRRDAAEKVEIKVIRLKLVKWSGRQWMSSSAYNDDEPSQHTAGVREWSQYSSCVFRLVKTSEASWDWLLVWLWTFSLIIMVNRFCD